MSPKATHPHVETLPIEYRRFHADVLKHAPGLKIHRGNVSTRFQEFDYGRQLGLAFFVFSPGHCYEEHEETYSHPDTWWDALKAASPILRLLRFRPHYKRVPIQIKKYRVCPHLEVDREKEHVTFLFRPDIIAPDLAPQSAKVAAHPSPRRPSPMPDA